LFETGFTKPRTITPVYSPAVKQAIEVNRNLRMTAWINKNPVTKRNLAYLNTKVQQVAIQSASGYAMTKNEYRSLFNVNLRRQGAVSGYLSRLSEGGDVLQQAAVQGAATQSKLDETTQAYTGLLAQPPKEGDLDLKTIAIYGGIAVVGLIALSIFLKRK
jgi:hypothetical protein